MPDAPSRSAPAERIGVALCTYNGARYLQAQLDSILDQDLPVNEVMIGDDGSSDQTLQLLQAFVPRAQALGIRVEIVQHARNLGYVRNFADALMRCQADILFLCDQDDVWHPGRVRRYVERFHADQGLLLLHSDAWLVDAQGAPLGQRLLGGTGGPSGRGRAGTLGPCDRRDPAAQLHHRCHLCAAPRAAGRIAAGPAGLEPRRMAGGPRIAAWRIGHAGRTDHRLPAAWQQPDRCQSPRFPATPAPSRSVRFTGAPAHGRAPAGPGRSAGAARRGGGAGALPGTSRARLAYGLVATAAVSPRGCAGRLDRP